MTDNVLTFPTTESKNMSDTQPQDITALGPEHIGAMAVLIRENGPLTVAKLVRKVWTNKNHTITKENRAKVKAFLLEHAAVGGWEDPKGTGNTWQIVGYVTPSKGAARQQYIPGTEPEIDEHVEPLVREYVALRAEAKATSAARDEANVLMKTAMREREMTAYQYVNDAGNTMTVSITVTEKTTVNEAKTEDS